MKTYFIVESDTEYAAMFAYQAEVFDHPEADVNYRNLRRRLGNKPDVCDVDPGRFFGKLNSLLPTRRTVEQAAALALVPPLFDSNPTAADLDAVAEEDKARQATQGGPTFVERVVEILTNNPDELPTEKTDGAQ